MPKRLFSLLALAVALSVGFLLLEELDARTRPDEVVEKWVSPNHLRVRVHGRWQEVPLVPLADHLCRSNNPMFQRYCPTTSR